MPTLTPEAWMLIRHEYEHTDKPTAEICAPHGISTGTLRDRVRRWGWTPRRAPIPPEGPPPTPAPPREPFAVTLVPQGNDAAPSPLPTCDDAARSEESAASVDPALIGARLQGAAARVLPAIEAVVTKLAAGPIQPREMERAGRALGTLTRTLRELNALLSQYPAPNPDRGPESDEEFINALADRLERFAEQNAAARAKGA